MTGKVQNLVFFPEELVALNKEILNHPELQEKLAEQPSNELEIRLATIAAYLDIMLDGIYTGPELIRLAEVMIRKLKEKSTGGIGLSSKDKPLFTLEEIEKLANPQPINKKH